MTNAVPRGMPVAGNPHVRPDYGKAASVKPRRGSLSCKRGLAALLLAAGVGGSAFAEDGYVETTWRQAVSTGWRPTPQTCVELDFALNCTTNRQARLIGTDGDNCNFFYAMYINGGGGFSFGIGDTFKAHPFSPEIMVDTGRHVAVLDAPNRTGTYVTGASTNRVSLTGTWTKTGACPMAIGMDVNAVGGTSGYGYAPMKIYGCRIWEAGQLVRDLRPCLVDGIAYLRDRVTGIRVGNTIKGTGVLAYGGDIPEELDDAYVQSLGSRALNSRFFMCPDARIELDYAFNEAHKNSQQRLLGADAGSYVTSSAVYSGGSGVSFGTGDKFVGQGTDYDPDVYRHTVIIDSANDRYYFTTGFLTNWTDTIKSTRTNTGVFPIGILGGCTAKDGCAFNNLAKAKLYGARFYKGGVLVHDYVPCVKGAQAGLKDLVDGVFITNEARNESECLIAGGDISREQDDGYIETHGVNQTIDTGYKVTSSTRIELDFAFTSTLSNSDKRSDGSEVPQPWLIGHGGDEVTVGAYNSGQHMYAYMDADSGGQFHGGSVVAALSRRTVVYDVPTRSCSLLTVGYTNWTAAVTQTFTEPVTNDNSLILFTRRWGKGLEALYPCAKVYGMRIYEDGVLVRDYVPYEQGGAVGLRDALSGGFLTPKARALGSGGAIATDASFGDDAYIESDGTQAISTHCFAKPATRMEMDFALTDAATVQVRPFGVASTQNCELYVDGSCNLAFGAGDTWTKSPMAPAGMCRYQAVLDLKNKTYSLKNGTKSLLSGAYDMSITATSSAPIAMFAKAGNAAGTTFQNNARMRLYTARLYENDVLLHEYLPYKEGDVVGLYDTVTKTVSVCSLAGASAFKVGGMGWDGSGSKFVVSPKGAFLYSSDATRLTAYAPGAVSYVWTKDGVTLAGETGGSIEVAWQRGRRQSVYRVTPVYSVRDKTVCGTAAEALVEYNPNGTCVILR